ncbi:MAG: YbjQ family protein [Chloroflexi bacterium]|nr:YbjQ family protein [Chloroflexota bacterium]
MILASSERIEGREISETIGLVRGNSVRARGIGFDIVAGVRNIFGGDIPEYTELINTTRDQATDRMVEAATKAGADAIVSVRYTTSMIAGGISEILAFGTAVKLR